MAIATILPALGLASLVRDCLISGRSCAVFLLAVLVDLSALGLCLYWLFWLQNKSMSLSAEIVPLISVYEQFKKFLAFEFGYLVEEDLFSFLSRPHNFQIRFKFPPPGRRLFVKCFKFLSRCFTGESLIITLLSRFALDFACSFIRMLKSLQFPQCRHCTVALFIGDRFGPSPPFSLFGHC